MKKNIFAIVAMLGMFGFVSCDSGQQNQDNIEPQAQEEQTLDTNEFESEDPALQEDQQMQDDQQMQEDNTFQQDESMQQEDMNTEDTQWQD